MNILTGINLFENRSLPLNGIKEFEDYFDCTIPPLYKIFQEHFNVKREGISKIEVYHKNAGRNLNIAELSYFGAYSDYIGLYNLLSLDESVSSMKNSYAPDDSIRQMGYAMIGECISNISLLLGIKDENLDKIFLEDTNIFPNGERIVFVSNNIFDFIRDLSLIEKENIGFGINGYTSLYKNWGESFWRIREDN